MCALMCARKFLSGLAFVLSSRDHLVLSYFLFSIELIQKANQIRAAQVALFDKLLHVLRG